ncbi:MAG: NUDIX hydrolase [Saprospiraceae bacterium]
MIIRNLESKQQLQRLFDIYIQRFPEEIDHQFPVQYFLSLTESENLYSRKNFVGHLTASAFILSADGQSVLLLHHKSLDRWLQAGGHIDKTDESILDAAYREVAEETGLQKENLQLLPTGDSPHIPFDIDSHAIPANPKKGEAAHVHHDFRYLFQVKHSVTVEVSAEESNGFRWVSLEDLKAIEDHTRVAKKISSLPRLQE